jgi:hypothetical protein
VEFEPFPRFVGDPRLNAIRVNPATIMPDELRQALAPLDVPASATPLYYDVKGRQLRVEQVVDDDEGQFEILLNHPIDLDISDERARRVLFKAGGDVGIIDRLDDGGQRLVFGRGPRMQPRWAVHPGDSLHILHPSLKIHGPLFSDIEVGKIQTALDAGFDRFFLSYVEEQTDIDALREIIGQGKEMRLKIESPKGLRFVQDEFVKEDGLVLTAARGDLFVEIPSPHLMTDALRLIIDRDPEACAASRLLLSVVQRPMPPAEKERALKEIYRHARWNSPDGVALKELLLDVFFDPRPSAAELSELAWLLDIGYRDFMLCDELCLAWDTLNLAVDSFRDYEKVYRDRDAMRRIGHAVQF